MNRCYLHITLLLVMVAASCGYRQQMLVSTDWLAARLADDPSLVILHVGSQKDYDAGHIPGARLVTLADISVSGEPGVTLELPPVKALEDAFGKLGVSRASRVVIYSGTDAVPPATRVWFTLDYLGAASRASLLDGGLASWRAEGRPLTTKAPALTPARFTARPQPEMLVDAAWIAARISENRPMLLLDSRAPEAFSGAKPGDNPRGGHIPGAHNVHYATLLDQDRKLKPAAALKELLHPGGQDGEMVLYCNSGYTVTLLYFAARYLGINPRFYDGSIQDWSRRPELPVATRL
jgi:thiosulfate/3-mercaptopyruvate sulfurtransferase